MLDIVGMKAEKNGTIEVETKREPIGYLEWRARSPSAPSAIVTQKWNKRHRSRSLVQLHNRTTFMQRDTKNRTEQVNAFQILHNGQDSEAVSSSVSSSTEKLYGNKSAAWARGSGSAEGMVRAAGIGEENTTRVDRKMSFSSILNRNSESYKQIRFRRASSFSAMPTEPVTLRTNATAPFESRIRIPHRQRPLSLNSYELERLKMSSHLPSPSEEMEIRNGSDDFKSSKFETVVEKAAAWLEESKSVMRSQCFSAETGTSNANSDLVDGKMENVDAAITPQSKEEDEINLDGNDSLWSDYSENDSVVHLKDFFKQFEGDGKPDDRSTGRFLSSADSTGVAEEDKKIKSNITKDNNCSYISDLRALLQNLREKKTTWLAKDQSKTKESAVENHFIGSKSDASCQFNGDSGASSPRVVSPRRFGTHANPFEQMAIDGSINSPPQLIESDRPQSCKIDDNSLDEGLGAIGQPRSCDLNETSENNRDCCISRMIKSPGGRHEAEEIEKEGENKTTITRKQREQDVRQAEERASTSSPLGKVFNEHPFRNSCRTVSINESSEEKRFCEGNRDDVFDLITRRAQPPTKLHRTSKSTSEIEVRIAEVQYFSAFKRNRRRRTTSSSSLLKWKVDLISNEVDVDSFTDNTSLEDELSNVGQLLPEKTIYVNKERKQEATIQTPNCLKNSETKDQGDVGSNDSDRIAFLKRDCSNKETIEVIVRETKEAGECPEDPRPIDCFLEDCSIDNMAEMSLHSPNTLQDSLNPDSMLSSSEDVSEGWTESKCCVEAILKNKTDDWKTANFDKIRGNVSGSESFRNGDGCKVNLKDEGPVVFVNQDDFGTSWFKEKRKKRGTTEVNGSDSKKVHRRSKLTGTTSPSQGETNLGFFRGKLKKLTKWSRRHSDIDSSNQTTKEKISGNKKEKGKLKKDKHSGDSTAKRSQNVSLYDFNRNFVLSSDFVRSSRRRREQLKFDRNGVSSTTLPVKRARSSNPVHMTGSIKPKIISGNSLHQKKLIAQGSSHLNVDDQTSLTTVSALSTKLQDSNLSEHESTITLTGSDTSDDSDSTISGPLMFSSSSSSDAINESVDKTEMPDFRSPSRIQEDLAVLLERKMTRKKQGIEEIDFHPLIPTTKGKALVSRDWLYDRVHHLVLGKRNSRSRALVVVGNHGCGKTTFLKSIVWSDSFSHRKSRVREALSSSVLSYHFCSQVDSRTTSTSKFVLNMAACLIENKDFASYTKALSENSKIQDYINAETTEKTPELAFRKGILEPLNEICQSKVATKETTRRYLILVDALEHQCTKCSPDECVTALLANNFQILPSWISLVVTGSKESLEAFSNKGVEEICLDNVANWDIQSDLYSFTEMELPIIASEGISKAKIRRLVDNVVRFSKGSFQIAHMAIQYSSSSFSSIMHQPNLLSLDEIKLVSHLFKLKFAVVERNRILALSLLDVLFVSKVLQTLSSLYKVVECSCSSQQISFQEYKACLEKLLDLQMIAESAEGKLFVTNATRKWLQSSDGLKIGFNPSKGHNLLSVYYMKTLTSTEGRNIFQLAYHLALSSFGEDIQDSENKVRFLAWTFAQVFKNSTAGFLELCNVYRPIPEVYHLFLHTDLDFKPFEKRYGMHPIVFASSLQQPAIVSLLLDHDLFDDTHLQEALKEASRAGSVEIIDLILQVKARIPQLKCEETGGGKEFLEMALDNNHLAAAVRLLEMIWEEGDDEETKALVSRRILCNACQAGKIDIVEMLLQKGIDVNIPDILGNVALVVAASKNNLVVAKRLVEHGAIIEAVDANGLTPLIASAMHCHVEISEWLISQDANADAEDREGKTPLLHAAAHNLSQLVHSLFMEGASLNHQDKEGLSALAVACKNSCLEAVKVLLKNRAFTDTEDNENRTALHYACANGSLRIIQLLLDSGANIGHKDLRGLKPFEYALSEKQLDAVVLLLKYGAHIGRTARNIAMRDIDLFLCLINHLEQRGNIMIRAGKYVEANECFQRAMNMIEASKFRTNKRVMRVKLLCEQDSRKKFI
eukprot:gene14861-5985_t